MSATKYSETPKETIAPGRTRYLAHSATLMTVVIDFEDGPHSQPDPPHSHPHEQVTYVASGELYFFIGEERYHLHAGDLISIAPDLPHSIQLISATCRLVDNFTPLRDDFLK